MKGQLTLEYLISFLVFIGLIAYIYLSYSANIPSFMEEVRKEDIRSKAFQLSEVLVNDPGEPENWNELPPDNIDRIGLLDGNLQRSNLISIHKVERLDKECNSDYSKIQKWLAFDRPFSIYIFDISQTDGSREVLVDCIPPSSIKTTINITIKRIVTFSLERNDTIVFNFVMTHSPYKQYDPDSGSYNLVIGRTPSSAGESIRYLRKVYEVTGDTVIRQKIIDLADYLLSIQYVTDPSKGWYGGFPSIEGATTYYSIDAVFGGEGLLNAYELTSNPLYLDGAIRAATFLRHMQTRDSVGLVDNYYGGFCEYVDSSNGAYLTRMYTKLILAVPFLDRLYAVTGNTLYTTMRDDAVIFLKEGLETRYAEYYDPGPSGDNDWHRIGASGNDVFGDSVAYALRALYEYEGLSNTVKTVYNFYQGFSGYDTRFGWAGYLDVVNKVNDTNYYDVAVTGILSDIRMKYDLSSYVFSRRKAEELGEKILFWGLNITDYGPVPDMSGIKWQDTVTASAIGSLLFENVPVGYGEVVIQM